MTKRLLAVMMTKGEYLGIAVQKKYADHTRPTEAVTRPPVWGIPSSVCRANASSIPNIVSC